MEENRHIVNKEIIEFEYYNRDKAFALQTKINSLMRNQVRELIDSVCSKYVNEKEIMRVDKIELNLGEILEDQLENQLVEKFKQSFDEEIASLVKRISSEKLFEAEKPAYRDTDLEIFKIFMLTGDLPWWIDKRAEIDIPKILKKLIAAEEKELFDLLVDISSTDAAVQRLIQQFPAALIDYLLQKIFSVQKEAEREIYSALYHLLKAALKLEGIKSEGLFEVSVVSVFKSIWESHSIQFSAEAYLKNLLESAAKILERSADTITLELLEAILEYLSVDRTIGAPIPAGIQMFFPAIKRREEVRKEITALLERKLSAEYILYQIIFKKLALKKDEFFQVDLIESSFISTHEEQPGGIETVEAAPLPFSPKMEVLPVEETIVYNAGIILLHPFLKPFFSELGLLNKDEFKNIHAEHRAIFILQYLAERKSFAPEYLLQLNKLLCGLDIRQPIPRTLRLRKSEKIEADHLLVQVIQHWKALRNTSPAGFRKSFLQRMGVLIKEEPHWKLVVERKSFDVLLETIPWNISIIRLPWTESIIYVDW